MTRGDALNFASLGLFEVVVAVGAVLAAFVLL